MKNQKGINRAAGHAPKSKEDVYTVIDSSGRKVLETLDREDAVRKNGMVRGLVFKNGVLL